MGTTSFLVMEDPASSGDLLTPETQWSPSLSSPDCGGFLKHPVRAIDDPSFNIVTVTNIPLTHIKMNKSCLNNVVELLLLKKKSQTEKIHIKLCSLGF